jgi:basic membrane protein A
VNAQNGLFAGNFDSLDDGRRLAQTLMSEGADIIMPVAGPVGLGAAAAIKEAANGTLVIGVDTDWFVRAPDYADIELTSVIKKMDLWVYESIQDVINGAFKGGKRIGTLENSGVDIAPFHNLDSKVPATLKTELDQVRADIIAGKLPKSVSRFQ